MLLEQHLYVTTIQPSFYPSSLTFFESASHQISAYWENTSGEM